MSQEALKTDLSRIKNYLHDHPDVRELVQPPNLAADSFTTTMWTKHMKPGSSRRGELMEKLSPEDEKRLMEHIQKLRSGQPDESTEGKG